MRNLSHNTNSVLVLIGLVLLPVAGVLYFFADVLWSMNNATPALAFILSLIGLIGCFLGLKTREYDGTMFVKEDPEGNRKFLMDLASNPDDFVEKDELTFRVTRSYLKESLIPEDQTG